MRQPEVARLTRLVSALLLLVPLLDAGRSMLVAAAFLGEFLTDGAQRPLSLLTDTPVRSALAVSGANVDRYTLGDEDGRVPLVLVHGLAPDGKADVRLSQAAALLARAGFDVAVPTIPGLTRLRLRPEDREAVVATITARSAPSLVPAPTVIVGVSVGAGVALLAAADERARNHVQLVLSLGGYASARELVRYYLTGDFGAGDIRGHRAHDPALVAMFVDANADLLDPSARRVLAAGPGDVARALGALSPELSRVLDTLSPGGALHRVRADVVLVHGRDDVAVPFTESVALQAARPERTRLVLVGIVGHVEAADRFGLAAGLRDLAALWSVVYGLVSRA